jgi:hypothetical protein
MSATESNTHVPCVKRDRQAILFADDDKRRADKSILKVWIRVPMVASEWAAWSFASVCLSFINVCMMNARWYWHVFISIRTRSHVRQQWRDLLNRIRIDLWSDEDEYVFVDYEAQSCKGTIDHYRTEDGG